MIRWWRSSLSIQLLTSMLAALVVSQAIGFAISWGGYKGALRTATRIELQSRAAAVARLMESSRVDMQAELALVNSTEYTRFWVSDTQAALADDWLREAFAHFSEPLRYSATATNEAALPEEGPSELSFLGQNASWDSFVSSAEWGSPVPEATGLPDGARYIDYADQNGAGVIVTLPNGQTLNAAYYKRLVPTAWFSQIFVSLAITAALVSAVGVLTVRRIVRPLHQLTEAAETLGRGETVTPLCECGPDDIKRTAVAFNRMQDRLHRFVQDRTRMLAAIGHDLRTPLTTLRLRTEFVNDPELQERMIATIDEMQAMTEATLALATQESNSEPTRTVDLPSFIESICDDLAELGHDVTFQAGESFRYRCRPDNLRRAVRNLIENAIRYAGRATVSIVQDAQFTRIVVEDEGPGIPIDKFEEVFAPFYRMEASRNRDTGGIGLGLSIARAIARQHGGDIVLRAKTPGLLASVILPS